MSKKKSILPGKMHRRRGTAAKMSMHAAQFECHILRNICFEGALVRRMHAT